MAATSTFTSCGGCFQLLLLPGSGQNAQVSVKCPVSSKYTGKDTVNIFMFQRITGLEVTAVESGYLQPRHPVSPAWLGRPME